MSSPPARRASRSRLTPWRPDIVERIRAGHAESAQYHAALQELIAARFRDRPARRAGAE
jgi:hypothetical protein